MATWKKIVTESSPDNISQNALTATTLEAARSFSISGEVETGSSVTFNGSANVDLAVTVKDGVIDVANFTPGTIVTESEGIAGSDNDTSIATNAAIIDYVSAQVSASGSGTITGVQVASGNGILSSDATNVTSGNFSTTLSAVGYDGISVTSDGINADVDTTTIQLTGSAGAKKIAAVTGTITATNNAFLVTAGDVFDYVAANTTNNAGTVTSVAISGTDGIQVDSGSPITSSGTITLGLSSVPITSLAESSITIGSTAIELGDSSTSIAGLTALSGPTGEGAGLDISHVDSIQQDNSDVSLFTSLGDYNVTIGSNNSGYGVVIPGDLTVNGVTTTINTTEVNIEDHILKLAHETTDSNQNINGATGGGIQLATNSNANSSYWPEFKWTKAKGGGNSTGAGTADGLTGWSLSNAQTQANTDHPVAIMDFGSSAPSSQNSAGIGSFFMDSTGEALYVRTA